jgi:hypothetical protein
MDCSLLFRDIFSDFVYATVHVHVVNFPPKYAQKFMDFIKLMDTDVMMFHVRDEYFVRYEDRQQHMIAPRPKLTVTRDM